VPSLTELLFWLGAGERLVGRTCFCAEPQGEVESVPIIGGTKDPRTERVISLAPDLVLANREENRKEDIRELEAAGLDVLLTDPVTVDGALEMIEGLGRLVSAETAAGRLLGDVRSVLNVGRVQGEVKVCVFVWREPWMVLGCNAYGHDLLERCGGRNVFNDVERYPEVSLDEVRRRAPDVILLPDEPYPFQHGSTEEEVSSFARTLVVDGKMLWWYGPRMPSSIESLRAILSGT